MVVRVKRGEGEEMRLVEGEREGKLLVKEGKEEKRMKGWVGGSKKYYSRSLLALVETPFISFFFGSFF